MTTTTKTAVEMPRDVRKALDKLLLYAGCEELRHYDEDPVENHIWLSIHRVLEWRLTLPGTYNPDLRWLWARAAEAEKHRAEDEAA